LKVRIRRVRQALGDNPDTPRFIETVHGRGYRFIAPLTISQPPPGQKSTGKRQKSTPPPDTQFPTPAFVGRDRELAELRTALEDVIGGQGRIILLTGEPGIGKTRTADELARYARARTIPVLLGHCEAGEGTPPLWPWTQVMRAYTSLASPQQLQTDVGRGVAELTQAFPEL
jgi:hypothetical protein